MTEQQDREEEVITPASPPRRSRFWRGIAAVALVAVLGGLTLLALDGPPADDSRYAVLEQDRIPLIVPHDPLRAELLRCRALPPQIDDAGCRAAWDENRRRFFGEAGEYNGPVVQQPEFDALPALNESALAGPSAPTHAAGAATQATER